MANTGYELYRSLIDQQVLIPYIQNAFSNIDKWPAQSKLQIANPRRHDSVRDDYFHPSVHADECALGCYLSLHPVERKLLKPERVSFTDVMTPLMGTVMHTIVQQKMIKDKLVTNADVEVALVNEERHWRGHADLMFRGKLVDIKTMRAEKFKYLIDPLQYWRYQLNPYMDALGVEESWVLVIEMGWPFAMKEFNIKKDPAILDEVYTKWEFVQESIQRDIPPSHEGCERRYCLVRERYNGDLDIR